MKREPRKRCFACRRLLALTKFSLDYSRPDHRQGTCRKCAREREEARRHKSLDTVA